MANELTTKQKIENEILSYANAKFNNEKEIKRFKSNVIAIIGNNKLLQKSNMQYVLSACYKGALLNLPMEQQFGYAYVVPYYDSASKSFIGQFQMGYKGYIQLALRTGQYETINACEVREGELISNDRLKGASFKWIENEDERVKKPIIGYVSYFKLSNGFESTLYWTKEKMEQHFMKYSQTYKKLKKFTVADYDSMAIKTILSNNLRKYGIMSVEMQDAYKIDQAVIKDNGEVEYIDNPKQDNSVVSAETVKYDDLSGNNEQEQEQEQEQDDDIDWKNEVAE